MKVLLDENLDHALRDILEHHEVVTVAYMGWAGLKNGELLRAAEEDGVDVLLTGDGTLSYEQDLPIIKKHLPKIIAAINDAAPGSFQMVDCGTFSRKKQSGG